MISFDARVRFSVEGFVAWTAKQCSRSSAHTCPSIVQIFDLGGSYGSIVAYALTLMLTPGSCLCCCDVQCSIWKRTSTPWRQAQPYSPRRVKSHYPS